MKLETIRKVRQATLDAPRGFWYIFGSMFVLIAAAGSYTGVDSVTAVGVIGVVGVFWLRMESANDVCPTCNSQINALSDRYCDVCGHRLDDIEAAPPIGERVSKKYRPVGLESIEATHTPVQATDGGEIEDEENEVEPEGSS
jgi:hypothetical protein